MPSVTAIRERLPSLYRPEPGEPLLVNALLEAVGAEIDRAGHRAGEVLQSRWLAFADRSLYHRWSVRARELAGLAQPQPDDRVDLARPAAVVLRLRRRVDPVATEVRRLLTPPTVAAIDAVGPSDPVSRALQRALVRELGALVRGPSLFDAELFAEVELSPETLALAASEPVGGELERLNRRLLEEAFPGSIVRASLDHPYVHDVARLGALVPLVPWTEPPALRESTEAYRLRLRRTVDLYRQGLGTRGALERVVEAELPADPELPPARRERPFRIEEAAPLVEVRRPIAARGAPLEVVGPLMRWTLENDGLAPAAPTVFVQGVEPVPGSIEPASQPLVELLDDGAGGVPVGLAFDGDLGPGETLRLRPAYAAWIGLASGLRRAVARPGEADAAPAADPTAPGPWRTVAGAPEGAVRALAQTADRALWVAVEGAGGDELWRFDGAAWQMAVTGLPAVSALAGEPRRLLVANAGGLAAVDLFPPEGEAPSAVPVPGVAAGVDALLADGAGGWWLGTEAGLARLAAGGTVTAAGLGPEAGGPVAVRALATDPSGTLYLGSDLGLFERRPGGGWSFYSGASASDRDPEWAPLELGADGLPAALPAPEEVFLPPVLAVARAADGSLWLGTERGIARYHARPGRGGALETVLEAFPDLGDGRTTAIATDERGTIWLGGERGLLGWDGRSWWQRLSDGLRHLGGGDLFDGAPRPRGAWRFDRGAAVWQRFDVDRGWVRETPAVRSAAGTAVTAVAWTDLVQADLGSFDGERFERAAGVAGERLRLRLKPSPLRIVDGGLPALPRLPAGRSEWRYLELERESPAPRERRPAWTREGRLLPPPEDAATPAAGRYTLPTPPPSSLYDRAVYAYCPAARVWFRWSPSRRLAVLARLLTRDRDDAIDPAITDRVFDGLNLVRPAGVRVALAVDQEIVRKG